MKKHLITPSLLNSWLYYMSYESDDKENEMQQRESFIKTLKKEFTTNKAIEFGKIFEKQVQEQCEGKHDFAGFIAEVASIVGQGTWQLSCKKNYKNFLLYGRMDVVNGNTIYDIKTTARYDVGKYQDSAQHKLYLYCTGLEVMKYVIVETCHGVDGTTLKGVSVEEYRDNNIEPVVDNFIEWLEIDKECKKLYYDIWKCKYYG